MKKVLILISMLCGIFLVLSGCKSDEQENNIMDEISTAPSVKLKFAQYSEKEPIYTDNAGTTRSIAEMRIVPSEEKFNQEWIYRFTYNPREKVINGHEIVILFGSTSLEIDGVTYVPEEGVDYDKILEWAAGAYNYYNQ